MLLLLVLAVLMATIPGSVSTRSFSEGCQPMEAQFWGKDKVGFYCFTEDKVFKYDHRYSMIELRHCVGNSEGELVPFKDGEYQTSCHNCTLHPSRTNVTRTCYLDCECTDMNEKKKKSRLDLNDALKSEDGRLTCFGHKGTRDMLPPACFHNKTCSAAGSARLAPRAQPTRFVRPERWV